MAVEIERKFLPASDAWRASVKDSVRLVQGYVANTPRCSVRVRIAGESAWLSLKSMDPGTTRHEFEYPVPREDAEQVLGGLCEGPLVEKIRHRVPAGRHCYEVDEFLGENAGLVVVEIELGAADEEFERPAWLGAEVTDQARYYNFMLVRAPFSGWPAAAREAARAGRHAADANPGAP
ncbi:MAG: CYTH domain-containing protein [Steroidobacteraceae bacterium]|jgi:adenylate cyclase|nr:CYTH domain-containing protein [Steroidobacteraceae bacterium]